MTEATFTAHRLEDALALVKRALGAEALILSSRRIGTEDEPPRFEVRASLVDASAPPEPVREPEREVVKPRELPVGPVERVLLGNDLPAPMARELGQRVTGQPRSMREIQQSLEAVLRGSLAFVGAARTGRVVALVGPTGVGKTTTIAKLAARDALIERQRVALISTDDYRVGGADQLERYADLIGVPFEAASDETALAIAIARHAGADRIYIDTAGRAPRDHGALARLGTMLAAAGAGIDVHLCLSAASRLGDVRAIVERHAVVNPRALTITKLDEAMVFATAVGAPFTTGLPLAYFTTGQRVPEDLELASAPRLAAALCGEEVGS